jgi:hypothetical protein
MPGLFVEMGGKVSYYFLPGVGLELISS